MAKKDGYFVPSSAPPQADLTRHTNCPQSPRELEPEAACREVRVDGVPVGGPQPLRKPPRSTGWGGGGGWYNPDIQD